MTEELSLMMQENLPATYWIPSMVKMIEAINIKRQIWSK
jgi:hypothetical protein